MFAKKIKIAIKYTDAKVAPISARVLAVVNSTG